MKKLYVLLMFIALVACVACQRKQTEERKNAEIQREHQAEEQHQVTQDAPKPNARETAPETRDALKSQAQRFQPRRIVPMTSPITETPTPTPTSSEPLPKS
jgi:Flp pilus assembly protein TadB